MKYLCLVYHEEAKVAAHPESEYDAVGDEVPDDRKEHWTSGDSMASSALQPVQAATTIRVRNGKMSIIDGPFAETKEQLAGFSLIDATDLNDAIRVASKMPTARLGCIEVRAIEDLNGRSRARIDQRA